jgi:hypothetical protein
MSQIFISYQNNVNGFVADELVKRIEKEGFSVWWDRQIPAGYDDWREKIDVEIDRAKVVLVVITPEAVASPYVTYEWSYALGKNKIVIPLTYQKATVHPRLNTHQALDFTNSRIREWTSLTLALHDYLDNAPIVPASAVVSKEGLLNALADLLSGECIKQSDLNLFVSHELISPMDVAEIRQRSMYAPT